MQWVSLASTALGAVIALLATTFNERLKWGREQVASRRKLCHETYSSFLAALTEAHERMRAESLKTHTPQRERATAIRTHFHDAKCYVLRYEIGLVAGQQVLDAAERSFEIMRDIRDTLADGKHVQSEQYLELQANYGTSLRKLQLAMRMELDTEPVHLTGGS